MSVRFRFAGRSGSPGIALSLKSGYDEDRAKIHPPFWTKVETSTHPRTTGPPNSKLRRERAKRGRTSAYVSRAPDECQLRRSVSDACAVRERVRDGFRQYRHYIGKPEGSHSKIPVPYGNPSLSDCLPSRLLRPQLKSRDYNSNSHEQFLSELSKVDPRGV